MEIIDEKKFEEVEKMKPEEKEESTAITEAKFEEMLEIMQNPVRAQQEICVQIKQFLDKQIARERERGSGALSDNTRRWIETYNKILDNIQKSLFGNKSVNLHMHKVSHGDIAEKIREAREIINVKKEK